MPDSIDISKLIGLVVYSFVRIGAALGMAVEDVDTQNRTANRRGVTAGRDNSIITSRKTDVCYLVWAA
jgi:hypothetical protein